MRGWSEELTGERCCEVVRVLCKWHRIAAQPRPGSKRQRTDARAVVGRQAEEVGAGTARSYALEREKRQLEESLKNVLVINDQLLQKVC
eukprot:863107-Rhodomonas_salina.2